VASKGSVITTYDKIPAGGTRTFDIATYVPDLVSTIQAACTTSVAAITGVVTGVGTTFTTAMVGGTYTMTGLTGGYVVSAFIDTTHIVIRDLDGAAYTGGAVTTATDAAIAVSTGGFAGIRISDIKWTTTDHATIPTHILQTWGLTNFKTGLVNIVP